MTMINEIEFAINNKCPLEFVFDGKPRQVCPYLLGKSAKGTVLQGFQYSTDPGQAAHPGWRFFYLDKIDWSTFKVLPADRWYPEPDLTKAEEPKPEYKPPKFITEVLAQVKF